MAQIEASQRRQWRWAPAIIAICLALPLLQFLVITQFVGHRYFYLAFWLIQALVVAPGLWALARMARQPASWRRPSVMIRRQEKLQGFQVGLIISMLAMLGVLGKLCAEQVHMGTLRSAAYYTARGMPDDSSSLWLVTFLSFSLLALFMAATWLGPVLRGHRGDELTEANRAKAGKLGYFLGASLLVAAWLLSAVAPDQTWWIIPLMIWLMVAIPSLSFIALEWRADRDG